jgi:hypothetical protein
LWLVSPSVALGAAALVLGYEAHDLDRRFGPARGAPLLGLPPAEDTAPKFVRRVGAFALGLMPWIALAARHAVPADAGPFVLATLAPFGARTERDLRALVTRSLLALPLLAPLHLFIPTLTPSFLTLLSLLSVDAWTLRSRPSVRFVARCAAVVVAGSELLPERAGGVGILASVLAYAGVTHARWLWDAIRAWAERVANSWRETRIGPVRIINHTWWAAAASCGGIVIIGSCLGPGHVPALVIGAACGLLGAGVWAQTIEGASGLSRPYGFYGGLLGISLSAFVVPWFGTPVWLLLGAVSVAGPFIQAVGRPRCLIQGCCHGSPAPASVGIRFRHPKSRVVRLAHLEEVPIHPTQIYSILTNVVTFAIVARLWSLHAALHLVGGVYLILNGASRFVEESYRGEPQTPVLGRLRLYQWIAVVQVITGAALTALGRSGPAPTPHPSVGAVIVAVVFGLIYGAGLGVDFPESSRRFSRLA